MPKQRKFLIALTLSSTTFLALLLILELGARALGYRGAPRLYHQDLFVPDPELGWRCAPDGEFSYLATEGWVQGSTGKDGYRPLSPGPEQSRSPIVICLGDSTTFCAEVRDEETWPEAAAKALSQIGPPCRMLNRGVGGYSLLQELLALRLAFQDEHVAQNARAVVYHFCINDPIENFEGKGPKLDRKEFAAGATPPEIGSARILSPQAWPRRGIKFRLKTAFLDNLALVAAIRAAGLDTSDEGFKRGGTANHGVSYDYFKRLLDEPHLQKGMSYLLAALAKECAARNVPLFVSSCVYPAWDDVGPSRRDFLDLTGWSQQEVEEQAKTYHAACDILREMTEEAGATYIDLRGCLAGMTHREYAVSPHDWHYSAAANERIGRAIAGRLRTLLDFRSR
ncbi:MAG: SGNH/GDSL hydrolase family protein [Planctomycetes bacterium]|nr:SGNH/GDSL hydrolase family protein [Planctomycetota bacterium]